MDAPSADHASRAELTRMTRKQWRLTVWLSDGARRQFYYLSADECAQGDPVGLVFAGRRPPPDVITWVLEDCDTLRRKALPTVLPLAGHRAE